MFGIETPNEVQKWKCGLVDLFVVVAVAAFS